MSHNTSDKCTSRYAGSRTNINTRIRNNAHRTHFHLAECLCYMAARGNAQNWQDEQFFICVANFSKKAVNLVKHKLIAYRAIEPQLIIHFPMNEPGDSTKPTMRVATDMLTQRATKIDMETSSSKSENLGSQTVHTRGTSNKYALEQTRIVSWATKSALKRHTQGITDCGT